MRIKCSSAADLPTFLSDTTARLPRRRSLTQTAALISVVHAADGGASVHSHFGNLKGQPLFAVSLYPERTVRINGRDVPPELILAFMRQNRDLLADPRVIVGSWYNADEDSTYLDVSAALIDRNEAQAVGREYNQIAIYDLEHEEEIALGGTGVEEAGVLPETERLKPWKR